MEKRMISVDRWEQGSQVYFLSHLHADHTVGLSPLWNNGPLYCTRITARLIPPKFPGFDLLLLRIIDVGRWYSLSLVSISSGLETSVEVMAIDANHCPGSQKSSKLSTHEGGKMITKEVFENKESVTEVEFQKHLDVYSMSMKDKGVRLHDAVIGAVMYLFRGEFGITLYTGDFRWEVTCKIAQMGKKMILGALKNDKIDTLYIDNTYCNPSYSFPSRKVAAQQILNIINSYPEHDIIIGVDTLGKEDLLLNISKMLKIKIWVWPERLQTMHLLGLHDNFTTKTTLTRVRAVPRYSFSVETLEGLNTMHPTIGIMPSGFSWGLKKVGRKDKSSGHFSMETEMDVDLYRNMRNRCTNNIEKHHQYIYTVPYSDHSCFPEIVEFVKFLCPNNVKGIVSSSLSYIDPCYHLHNIYGTSSLYQKHLIEQERERVDSKCKSTSDSDSFTEEKRKKKKDKKVSFVL